MELLYLLDKCTCVPLPLLLFSARSLACRTRVRDEAKSKTDLLAVNVQWAEHGLDLAIILLIN